MLAIVPVRPTSTNSNVDESIRGAATTSAASPRGSSRAVFDEDGCVAQTLSIAEDQDRATLLPPTLLPTLASSSSGTFATTGFDLGMDAPLGMPLSYYTSICDSSNGQAFVRACGKFYGTLVEEGGEGADGKGAKEHVEDGGNTLLGGRLLWETGIAEIPNDSLDLGSTASVPLGCNYRLLRGNQGTVLVLGFLQDATANESILPVERMEDLLEQQWFTSLFVETTFDSVGRPQQQPLKDFPFDAALVLAHKDTDDASIDLLHKALRGYVGLDVAVAYATGRTRRRARRESDDREALRAGRFPERIRPSFRQTKTTTTTTRRCPGRTTADGREPSRYIRRTMEHAGAIEVLGCADGRCRADGGPDDTDALSRLWWDRVLPASTYLKRAGRSGTYYCGGNGHSFGSKEERMEREREHHIIVQASDPAAAAVQYNLFPGAMMASDIYRVAPLDDSIVKVAHSVCGDVVLRLVDRIKNGTAGDDHVTVVTIVVFAILRHPRRRRAVEGIGDLDLGN